MGVNNDGMSEAWLMWYGGGCGGGWAGGMRADRYRLTRCAGRNWGGIHRTKNVRWKTVPPLRSPTRQNAARKRRIGLLRSEW